MSSKIYFIISSYLYICIFKIKQEFMIKSIINKRRIIQAGIGAVVYILVSKYQISLWYVLAAGAVTGIIFGKIFCRWMCPLGFMMEIMMGLNPDGNFRQMYQYHKIGCPIAWVSGLLNKISFFKVTLNKDTCKTCGKCDTSCYISTLNPEFSLYKNGKTMAAEQFSCSKCLKCVESCPNGSLSYKLVGLKK